jgi:fructokinase
LSLVGLNADGVPSYAFYGEGTADRLLPMSALAQVPPARAFHFGSWLVCDGSRAGGEHAACTR